MSSEITNDQQLRTALNDLALEAQRRLGARFVASVSHLSANPILTHGLQVAENAQASAAELDNAYKACKKLAIDTYTACGRDADWLTGHARKAPRNTCRTCRSRVES